MELAIILVSHNLHSISYICSRTVVFEKGIVLFDGDTEQAIDIYRTSLAQQQGAEPSRAGTGEVKISHFEVLNSSGNEQGEFSVGEFVRLRIHYHANKPIQDPVINIAVHGQGGTQVTGFRTDADDIKIGKLMNDGFIDITIPEFNLLPNVYSLTATLFHADGFAFYDRVVRIAQLKIGGGHIVNGMVHLPHSWQSQQTMSNLTKENSQ